MANLIPYFPGNVKEKNHANPLGERVSSNSPNPPCDNPVRYTIRRWAAGDQLSLALEPATEPHLYLGQYRAGYGSILYTAYLRRDHTPKKARKNFPLSGLPEALKAVRGMPDSYIAGAEFFRPEPRAAYIARIGVSWLDLDTYNVPTLRELTAEQIIYQILDACDEAMLPRPTLIMSSGRGYYAKWIYNKPIPHPALERWSAIQRVLHDLYRSMGSDRSALDAAHVLRIERTINSKNGQPARVVWDQRDGQGELVKYDFEFLAYNILPLSRQELRDRREERAERKAERELLRGEVKEQKHTNLKAKSIHELYFHRLCDLRTLYSPSMRGPVPEGMRDKVFFLALCFACWTHTFSGKPDELAAIWREFVPGLRWRDAKGYAASAMRRWEMAVKGQKMEWNGRMIDPRYYWRTATILDWLEISPEEQRRMLTLIGSEERRRRDIERYAAARRVKGQVTREEYLNNAAIKRIDIEAKLSLGLKPSVIAKELGCHRSAVYAIKKVSKVRPVI